MSRYNPEKSREYYRSITGLFRRIYNNQKMISKKRNMPLPTYTYDQLFNWATSQPHFQIIYDNWVLSQYDKNLIPSIDRIDNKKGYSINNIRLVTFKENLKNICDDYKKSRHSHPKSKPVKKLSLDGIFIKEYTSIGNAMRDLKNNRKSASNISRVCNGELKTAYGYIWSWA